MSFSERVCRHSREDYGLYARVARAQRVRATGGPGSVDARESLGANLNQLAVPLSFPNSQDPRRLLPQFRGKIWQLNQ